MILIAIYHHPTLYDLLKKDNASIDKFHVEHFEVLDNPDQLMKFDIVIIHGAVDEFGLLDTYKFNDVQVIYVNEAFTVKQVKTLLTKGAYNCLQLPIALSKLTDELTNAYKALIQERKQRWRDEKYFVHAVRESLAYDLLYGNAKNAKEIWERGKLANLSSLPNIVLLLSIDNFSKLVRNKGEMWKSSLREEVLDAMIKADVNDTTLKVLVDQSKYAILLSLPVQLEEAAYKQQAIEYAEKIQLSINQQTEYTVTIGIGHYYEDARNLHLSYIESVQAQTNRLFSRENSIIHVSHMDYFKTSAYYTFKDQMQKMTHAFLLGDVSGVHKQWDLIYHQVASRHLLHPEDFRLQILDLLFSLSKSAMQNGANPKKMMPLQIKYAKELHEVETLAEMDTWMKDVIQEFMYYVNEAHDSELLKSVHEVLQYMDENYAEDIGLDKMAEKVELSPNYLSAIFKQTTGSSFIDYLTDLRMKKAKDALQHLHISISEIAQAVGYSSSQYFSRVFKNNVGMTPSAFRNHELRTKELKK